MFRSAWVAELLLRFAERYESSIWVAIEILISALLLSPSRACASIIFRLLVI